MIDFNIYFGTIGKTLGVRYRYTRSYKNESEALKDAKNAAAALYYKNEGTYGLPSYQDIVKESRLTGLSMQVLYNSHISDMTRYFVIPTEADTVPNKELKYS